MNAKTLSGITALLLTALLLFSTAACRGNQAQDAPANSAENGAVGDNGAANATGVNLSEDRSGNPITLPETIDRILSMSPSNTEILVALGFSDKIVATDAYSENVQGIKPGISTFDMLYPDGEQIIDLQPDVIFVTGMSKETIGDDPFKVVSDAGICIIYIPSPNSIAGIKEDIRYIAAVMGATPKGEEIIVEMEKAITNVKKTSEAIADKKTVYFEIAAAPYMYSFGKGVFLHELIELAGATNFLEDRQSWTSVADETILAANPDVIFTTVDYIDNPVGEIKSRPGWGEITAVKNGDVYYIDTDSSNRPSHNVVKALLEIAKALYPDHY